MFSRTVFTLFICSGICYKTDISCINIAIIKNSSSLGCGTITNYCFACT